MASSSSTLVRHKREVFLSFRGEDTRYTFTSHLYTALRGKAIDTFIDNNLKRGEEISPALLKEIEESMISIVILSENYASSSWCLDELSKIIECKKTNGQKVVPIFYHVDPSDVRKQTGSFAEAFAKYDESFKDNNDKVKRWRAALTEVANLSGWPLQKDRSEAKSIEEIIQYISKELIPRSSNDAKGLVGIDSCVEQIESFLRFKLEGVRIVGIWGMGGIGKTTISEVVFNRFSTKFEGSCFLPNVREESEKHGLVHLQEKLLSKILDEKDLDINTILLPSFIEDRLHRKKVLIVLDDVDDSRQLELLHGKYCFGPGSRIIVTSRDRQVLQPVVDEIFEVKGLIYHEALQLFSLNAFKQNHPTENFVELSNMVVNYAKGLPLALKVLGSALYGKSKRNWESALNKLKKIPNPQIHDMLRISYDGLDDSELKDIFLDVACFFKGDDTDSVIETLDSCYFSTSFGISVLIDKSLVTISYKILGMHDLLQEMGWNIVRAESLKEPGKRSRLWIPEDVRHVLKNNNGTEAVQAIFLDMSKIEKIHLSPTTFAKMYNLKLLKLYHSGFRKDKKLYLPQQGLESLPNSLRYIHWDDYHLTSLPSNFCPENLVVLNMPNSHVERLWNGDQNFVNLKRLNLSCSQHLIELPDLSHARDLERMELDGCINLVEVLSSIRYLNKLSYLSLWNCKNLRNLPSIIDLKYLRVLILSGCSNVTKFPEISGNLEELYLTGTAIEEVPSSVGCLSRLKYLYLNNCERLKTLSRSICKLGSLEILELSSCSELESFPEILEPMQSLQKLHLGGTAIQELHSSIHHLDKLTLLNLGWCKKLKNLPTSIHELKSIRSLNLSDCSNITKLPEISSNLVELFLSGTAIVQLPSSINCLYQLVNLDLKNCTKLESLPRNILKLKSLRKLSLPGSDISMLKSTLESRGTITSLTIRCLKGTTTSWSAEYLEGLVTITGLNFNDVVNLCELLSLQELCFSDCNILEFLKELTCISSLRRLVLSGNNFERIPESIKQLSGLEFLDLSNCKRLRSLPELPPCLQQLDAHGCRLSVFPKGLTCISSLRRLILRENNFARIPESIKQLSGLECLDLSNCKRLKSLPELPPCLQQLDAHYCKSLEAVPSLLTSTLCKSNKFMFTNCLGLDQEAVMAEAQLRIQQKATEDVKLYCKERDRTSSFIICFPGSEIPEWFTHQIEGPSIAISLPLHLDDRKIVGFSLCAVLAFKGDNKMPNFSVNYRGKFKSDRGCSWVYGCLCDSQKFSGPDHVLLAYNFHFYKEYSLIDVRIQPKIEFDISVTNISVTNFTKVKKCGVCILYAQDDPPVFPPGCVYKDTSFRPVPLSYNLRVIQPSSWSNENFVSINRSVPRQPSEGGSGSGSGSSPCDPTWLSLDSVVNKQDFVEPVAEDGAIIKRCRDDNYNEAETSGDHNSDEEEGEPHPKRLKYIEFF